ncbi:GvpL/GvpF family gas vesicle protein [Streptomyces sp. NPDC047985]|uniref:GvpL/GvpF family gas vesicle protein n=1 Tax=Streptomyces sp. NPDC047985 TaxID=3155384 RepID=UPI00343E9547
MTAGGPYVYGIVKAGHPLPADLRGVGTPAAALELLSVGATAAVVSAAPARLRARRRDLLAHQEVLLALALDGPVLPMRFGMLAPDAETVHEQLKAGRKRYPRVLERLADRVEMNVKALSATGALAALVADEPHIRQLREAAQRRPGYEANVRLGEAVVHTLARRAADAAQQVVPELLALAVARSPGPQAAGTVLNMSFLVDRQDTAAFQQTVHRLSAEYQDRVELRVAGPLPCYSFTELEPEPSGRAVAVARTGS